MVPVVRRTEVVPRGVGASFKEENGRFARGVRKSMSEEAARCSA
jgi:hypothetical protein